MLIDHEDNNPTIVETTLQIYDAKWNRTGSLLAVCGTIQIDLQRLENAIEFYNPDGKIQHTLYI